MKKTLFGLLVISLLVISGCALPAKLGGVQTLKQYYAHEPLKEDQDYMPLDLAARAKIVEKNKCSDVKLPDNVSNDCYIFGGDTIIIADEDGYSREYSTLFGQIPYYLFNVLQEGDTCNFIFDRYSDGNIIDVNECGKISREQIENSEKEAEKITWIDTFYEGKSSKVFGESIILEKFRADESIIVSVDGNSAIIEKGIERIVSCLWINYYDNADNGRSIFLKIRQVDLCNDNRQIEPPVRCLDAPKGFMPNPTTYPGFYDRSNPIHKTKILHRTAYSCEDNSIIDGPQVIDVETFNGGYCNYICRNRYKEHCIEDGSFDQYYDEWCEDADGNKIAA